MAELDLPTRVLGENVDRLISLDPRHWGLALALYEAARRRTSAPLAMGAAQALLEAGRERSVLICTGFPVFPLLIQETDGLMGAACLARAVDLGLAGRPVLITEASAVPMLRAACRAAGLYVETDWSVVATRPHAALIQSFPTDVQAAREAAQGLLEMTAARVVLATEKAGPNEVGVCHSSAGRDITPATARVDPVFDLVAGRDGVTIGIGDQGNEVGLGAVRAEVAQLMEFGATCQCPCGKGMASGVSARHTVIGAVSDWGALGIVACLAHLVGNPNLLPDPAMVARIVEQEVDAGAIDAVSRAPLLRIDGYDIPFHQRLVTYLRDLVVLPAAFTRAEPHRYRYGVERSPLVDHPERLRY
jgi:hypothetical protein